MTGDIEIYTPSRCFRCQAPIYLKGYEFKDGYYYPVAHDYYRNSRHFCLNRLIPEEIVAKSEFNYAK